MRLYWGILLLSLVSCVGHKDVNEISLEEGDSQRDEVVKVCDEINSSGDIMSLLNSIKKDHKQIQRYLKVKDPYQYESEILELADEINKKGEQVVNMVIPEWTTPKVDVKYSWDFNKKYFRPNPGTYTPNGFSLLGFEVEDVFLMGVRRDDLKPQIGIDSKDKSFRVSLNSEFSYLTACQLISTLNIIIKVKFRSFRTVKYRWFNLFIQKGDLLKL